MFKFLSTPSGWRATLFSDYIILSVCISIHALRVEGDFNDFSTRLTAAISIHALRVEGDHIFDFDFPIFKISIHALRVEGDCKKLVRLLP